MRKRNWLLALFVTISTLLTGAAMAGTKTVSGTVSYLDRSMLPPGAVLDVALVDVSRADAPSIQLAARRYAIDHVPFAFELAYDAPLIDLRFTYAIQARISLAEQVIYRSTTFNPALTHGAPETIDIIVDLMPASATQVDQTLEGTDWDVNEIQGRTLVTEKRPSISFLPEGRVSAGGSCNRFNGAVELTGTNLRFSDHMAGTMMACPSPYDKQEQDFLNALRDVTGYVMGENSLALTNEAGTTVLGLSRSQ